ncbi:oxygen-dependent coproporphyrinogen oxidase [Rickettsia endosymbiont of Cardiosporidium cionae]|uniref:oxygen-dependent coproporphyrinogen oxidase n=1 Tax=Rickettsia endosymbiont of Cardiosporidium cionae TaxID=2777155 RepID=UPI0018941BB0|nr:oxygen-dependent coproporphyrinogen oxidase [Rickettsia endosymbiont of Cardiosporidium cionae]KAF8818269.1 oxygen-dependent coproporphyrinogen oxidase [Rickettsia endosymbiont of Cardiosporidium cionae]
MDRGNIAAKYFTELRDKICLSYESIEAEYQGKVCSASELASSSKFQRKIWKHHAGSGGGEISIMRGKIFEKVGVNISSVSGIFDRDFATKIPGTENDRRFFATGISLVAHMQSPLIPAIHFNTRYIETTQYWFGGGIDLTPIYPDELETRKFHNALEKLCNKHNSGYYEKFKLKCDEYFYLKHRNEPRGVGGIFFDYMNNGDYTKDLNFVKDVGITLHEIYPEIILPKINLKWNNQQREYQLKRRGRYVEFNLLYDRGTSFGLATGGNVEAIFMSLPPVVKWD